MATFWLDKHGSLSSSLGFALGKFTKFFIFLALKYIPIMGLTDITKFEKKKQREEKGILLKFCSRLCQSFLSRELRFGLGYCSVY